MSPAAILAILQVLETFAYLLQSVPEARSAYEGVLADVERFVAEDRDPTPAELGTMVLRVKGFSARIQKADG